MSYDQFLQDVKAELSARLGKKITIKIQSVQKNNGCIRKGYMFCDADCDVAPTIYMEEFFGYYLFHEDLQEIVSMVLDTYQRVQYPENMNMDFMEDFQLLKHHIIYHLVNYEKNQQLLKQIPHRKYLDFAIIYYVLLDTHNIKNTAKTLVRNEYLSEWKVTEKELFEIAHNNTRQLLPSDFSSVSAVMTDMMEDGVELEDEMEEGTGGMYVLTNQIRCYGAATLLYEEQLKWLGVYFRENFYVLPSSVHEVLVLPESMAGSLEELSAIVKEVNETQVEVEDLLSDHAYYYDRVLEKLIC